MMDNKRWRFRRRSHIQRLREGFDWTWWIVIFLLMIPVIAGVLHNNGHLNFIP